ncbi:unnamed protein product [Closterium sp. NIES-53]
MVVEVVVLSEPGGVETEGAEPGGAETGGAEPGGAATGGPEPEGAEPGGAGSTRVASRGASSRREVLSPQELREWIARRWSRAAGAGGTTATTCPGGAGAAGPDGTASFHCSSACPVALVDFAASCRLDYAASLVAESESVCPPSVGGECALSTDILEDRQEEFQCFAAALPHLVSTLLAPEGDPDAPDIPTPRSYPEAIEGPYSSQWQAAMDAEMASWKSTGTYTTHGPCPPPATAFGAAGYARRACPLRTTLSPSVARHSGGQPGHIPLPRPSPLPGVVLAGSGGAARPRPYFVPLLEQVQSASPLPAPSPYTGPTGGLTERCEPESHHASPVRAARIGRRGLRQRPPPVPGTHQMALRPSTAPQCVPLPSPPESSLPALADPEFDSLRAASPTVTRLLATLVTDPSFESTPASALVAELVDFAAHCRLDYAASLVAESASVCPLSGDPDASDIPTPRFYTEAIEGPYSSQWQTAMDAEMASEKSTGTYVDEVPPPGANIVDGMWIFRVKRPPSSPPVFKARYMARGFSQRQGVDYFQTFSPTPKMTTLRVLLHIAAQRDYELHSLDFSTAFLQGSLHEEIWLRRPPGFTASFPPGTQWSLRRPVYGLRQAPREWHDTLRTTLVALGFAPSTADPSLFLRTDSTVPLFYILVYVDDLVFATADTAGLTHVNSELQKRHTCTDLDELRSYLGLQITRDRARRTITLTQSHMVQQVLQRFNFMYSSPQATPLSTRHSLSALPSDESIDPSGLYPELVGCLMYLMTCTRPDLAYPLSILARYVAPGRHRPEHMDAAKRVLRYLCSTSGMGLVLGGRAQVVLTGHADASWVDDLAMQRSSQGYTFSLGSGSVLWRSTRSSSVLISSCEAEIYAGAIAAQELRWLTYLLTDL